MIDLKLSESEAVLIRKMIHEIDAPVGFEKTHKVGVGSPLVGWK